MELRHDSKLIQNLFLKKELLRSDDKKHKKIRTLLLILGGTNLGAYGAGASIALHLLGLADVFDVVVGVSTGAAIGGYYLAGEDQMFLGTSIYYTELCGTHFINYRRIKKIIDIDLVSRTLRRGRTKMEMEAILRHRSMFFVGATNAETGNGEWINAKSATPDILGAIEASLWMPLGYNLPVLVNQQFFYDGGVAFPCPIREVCEKFQPTDILVLPNRPLRFGSQLFRELTDRLFVAAALHCLPTSLRRAIVRRHRRFVEGMDFVQECSGINIGVLSPPEMGIHQLTRESPKLRAAVYAAVKGLLPNAPPPTSFFRTFPQKEKG